MGVWARVLGLALLSGALAATAAPAPEDAWPLRLRAGDTVLFAHQPQVDAWDGYTLRARLAVAAREPGKSGKSNKSSKAARRYGVVELGAVTLTDHGRRRVTLRRARLRRADFPGVEPARARAWGLAVARALESGAGPIALDRLEAALGAGAAVALDPWLALRNDPPHIVFSERPALLVSIDGAPVWRALAGTAFERVLNTRALLLRDGRGRCYLKVFDGWMSAPAVGGPWSVLGKEGKGGKALRAAFALARRAYRVDALDGRATPDTPAPTLAAAAPRILVATAPTELLVTDGAADFRPIAGTRLSYVANGSGHVFRDELDHKLYVLLSGRWFRASTPRGPWTFVAADRLPVDFSRIPDTSPQENVKASVAGTAQARAAAVAAGIAQTARVDAGLTLPPPRFDGAPLFEPIAGTGLAFAANTPTPLIRLDDRHFYALANGVWFGAGQPGGPWRVAREVPAAMYSIPVSSPLYYVTFVRVYGADERAVHVGYTAGYLGTLIDPRSRVVVYGTGYAYRPWIGSDWYGRPRSYGFGAAPSYTPWTGWSMAFGFGWSWSQRPSAVGWGWGLYPWWEPWGRGFAFGPANYPWHPKQGPWHPERGAAGWDAGGWAAYSGNLYRNWGRRAQVAGAGASFETWSEPAWAARIGLSYNSRTGFVTLAAPAVAARSGREPLFEQVAVGVKPAGDDLYAGRDGRVYRRAGSFWQQSVDGGWRVLPFSGRKPDGGREHLPRLSERLRQLERENSARRIGARRVHSLRALPTTTHGSGAFAEGELGAR